MQERRVHTAALPPALAPLLTPALPPALRASLPRSLLPADPPSCSLTLKGSLLVSWLAPSGPREVHNHWQPTHVRTHSHVRMGRKGEMRTSLKNAQVSTVVWYPGCPIRARLCVRVRALACARMCVCARVCPRVCARVCVRACVCARSRERVCASARACVCASACVYLAVLFNDERVVHIKCSNLCWPLTPVCLPYCPVLYRAVWRVAHARACVITVRACVRACVAPLRDLLQHLRA